MKYQKPWMSYQDQLHQLKERGLQVTDNDKALDYLERIGYYRLSGYWFPFRERSGVACPLGATTKKKTKKVKEERIVLDQFKPGASFSSAVDLYVFDKKLRLLALDALERIEVGLRVDLAYLLGRNNAFSYLAPESFHSSFAVELDQKTGLTKHHRWLENHARVINRSKEGFIKHNKEKYGLPLPIWIACEVWDFGTMSNLFSGLTENHQDEISLKYGIANGRTFASWLRCLNYLRNICAHHNRLWNRNIIDQPKKPAEDDHVLFAEAWNNKHIQARPFLLLCIAQHLLKVINPSSSWWARLTVLMNDFPDLAHLELNLQGMGVIEGWELWEW